MALKLTPQVGNTVEGDDWNHGFADLEAKTWDSPRAEFWLPSPRYTGVGCHVTVKVTGRAVQYSPVLCRPRVRVRVTWLRDDPAENMSGGAWLYVTEDQAWEAQ